MAKIKEKEIMPHKLGQNIRRDINEQHMSTSGETRPGETIAHRIKFSKLSKRKRAEWFTRLEKSWHKQESRENKRKGGG